MSKEEEEIVDDKEEEEDCSESIGMHENEKSVNEQPKKGRKRQSTFVVGLYRLLQEEPLEISMAENGDLTIINPTSLEAKLSEYFNTKHYTSFQRQLNNFGYVKHDWRDCTRQNSLYVKRRGPPVLKPSDILALSPVPTNPEGNKRKRGRSVPPVTHSSSIDTAEEPFSANSCKLRHTSPPPALTLTKQDLDDSEPSTTQDASLSATTSNSTTKSRHTKSLTTQAPSVPQPDVKPPEILHIPKTQQITENNRLNIFHTVNHMQQQQTTSTSATSTQPPQTWEPPSWVTEQTHPPVLPIVPSSFPSVTIEQNIIMDTSDFPPAQPVTYSPNATDFNHAFSTHIHKEEDATADDGIIHHDEDQIDDNNDDQDDDNLIYSV